MAILTPDGKLMDDFMSLQAPHSLHKKQLGTMANKPRRLFKTLQTLLSTRQASMLSRPSRLARAHRTPLEATVNKPRRVPRTVQSQHRTRQAVLVSRPSRLVRAHRTLLLTTLDRPRVLSKTVQSLHRTRQANLVSRASRLGEMLRAQPLTTASRQQTAPKPWLSLLRAQQEAITSKPRMLLQVYTLECTITQANMCVLACTASFAVDYRVQLQSQTFGFAPPMFSSQLHLQACVPNQEFCACMSVCHVMIKVQ